MRKTNFFKSSLMIMLMCFGLTSLWGQETTFFEFTGTYSSPPADGWTSSGNVYGGSYLRLDPGSVTSPLYDPAQNLVFKYDIASYGSGSDTNTTLSVLSSSNDVISQFTLVSATSSTYITNNTVDIGNITTSFKIKIEGATSRGTRLQNYSLTGETVSSTDPTLLTTSTSITGLTYMEGEGPSDTQSFELSGANLDGTDVTLLADGINFEISESETSGYTDEITLSSYDGTATTIWVRLVTGQSIGNYDDIIYISGGDATDLTIDVSGEVTEYSEICGFEDFSNSNATASYSDDSFTGNNGITWTYVESRDENGDNNGSGIDGKALMLRRQSDDSKITSSTISTGIQDFSVKLYKGFTGGGTRQVGLYINGELKGTSTGFDDFEEHTFTLENINISGDIIIELRNITGSQIIIDDITWTCYSAPSPTITWTTDGTWSNETGPTIDDDVIVEGVLFVGSEAPSFEAKTLTLDAGGAINIEAGNSVTVAEAITNNATAGDFIVESGASLVQTSDAVNTGEITVERNSSELIANDVTFWSSPVGSQSIVEFTAAPYNAADVWEYDTTSNAFVVSADSEFQQTVGYAIRSNSFEGVINAEFQGVPFNGNITFSGSADGMRFNLVGNPYASPINAYDFLDENTDATRLLFWTHTAPLVNGNYASSNYAQFTEAGGVAAAAGGEQPNGQIQVGQGFMTRIATGGNTTLTFTNDMRETANNNQFYKNTNIERNRIWLNLTSDIANHNQLMIAYMDGATDDVDSQIDAAFMNYNGNAIYSLIEDSKYAIQGKGLPFETSDVVPLGFNAVNAGSFIISIENVDGFFTEGEVIVYLKDNLLDITHSLSDSGYSFTSEAGEFNERFEVIYEDDGTMATEDLIANSVQIYTHNQNIVVESKNAKLVSVELFDLSGRKIHSNQKVNANLYQIASTSKGVLVVRALTQKGEIVTKKVINN